MLSRHLRLMTALHALGPTADDLAETLDDGGWSGVPGDATRCPIAEYLTDVVPDATGAAVSASAATVFTSDGVMTETVMPPGAAQFVDQFDDGAYRYLAEPGDDQ
jgi:hypothetical protein